MAAGPPARLALVLGAEGDGLTARTIGAADLAVRIPMAGGVDSLNVAAAGAVALWALRPPPGIDGWARPLRRAGPRRQPAIS